MEAIRKKLQCQSCKGPMFPPFLMCEKGETVCCDCRRVHKKCPLCHKKYTNNDNEALETLAQLPCFNCNTCGVSLKLVELKDHYSTCIQESEAVEIRCPIGKCSWKGKISSLADHWRNKGLALYPFVEDNICRTKLSAYSYFCNMMEALQSIFFFKSLCKDGKFFWALQYVGNPNDSNKFYYEIEILNPHKLACKFILSSFCQSIELSNEDLFREDVSIFTPEELLKPYLTSDGLLLYNLRVHEVNEGEMEKYRKKVTKLLERNKKK